jgi:hypothetical protein
LVANTETSAISVKDFREIVVAAIEILKIQTNFIELDSQFKDVLIIGDTHGDIKTTVAYATPFLEEKVNSIIFLGDYVDRGESSIVNLTYILSLLILWPENICILRGNHEKLRINKEYGFADELEDQFTQESVHEILSLSANLYGYLSLACLTPRLSFCVHGGLPINLFRASDIKGIPKPHRLLKKIEDIEYASYYLQLYEQLRWNDPDEDLERGFDHNSRGEGIYTFSKSALQKFLTKNQFLRMIRAHQSSRGGFEYMFNGLLLHVFSTEPYFGKIEKSYAIHETQSKTWLRDNKFNKIEEISDPEIL